ncbi:MAG TPA: hypothetical protein PLU53_02230 [Bacteroidia bacterium]|nr:hypothetical protein [Bacteroidia bacterium]
MRTIKVQELSGVLKPSEVQAFQVYLLSPLYNNNKRVLQLHDLLRQKSETDEIIDKKELHKILFPGKRYDDKQLRYLFSYLSGHIENFLALREFEKDRAQYLLALRRSLAERNAGKAYAFARVRFREMETLESVSHYLHQYQSAELDQQFSAARVRQADYQSILSNLDHFYFLRKLQLHCELINLGNVFQSETNMLLIDEICRLIVRNKFFESPLIEVYYGILMMLTCREKESEEHFQRVSRLIHQNNDKFPVTDLNNVYQYLKNFCIRLINKGNDGYRNILFVLYKTILSNRRLMGHRDFSPWEYKNIVTLGLRLQEEKWVKEFIRKYIHYLPVQQRANALTYNSAMLAYYQKNFRQTLKYLQAVEFTDLYYQLDSRSILLKVYFETDDIETMLHHISAFKIFIRRNKLVSAYQREIYLNFIRYTLKIFRAGTNTKKLDALREEVLSQQNISDKNWLLEKISEMA